LPFEICLRDPAQRRGAEAFAIEGPQITEGSATQVQRLVQHRVEDRREAAGGGVDDLQHLGHRRSLGQRLVALGFALGKLTMQIGYELLGIGERAVGRCAHLRTRRDRSSGSTIP